MTSMHSLPNQPLVSIVMPSLNQARFLPLALDSVLQQDYSSLELIVADGGSTDGSLDILRNYADLDARLRWTSQQDNGPADAINTALQKVRGTVIGWLNSDDMYAPGAISRVLAQWAQRPRDLMIYGQGQHIDQDSQFISDYPTLNSATPIETFAEGCFICQPTVFFQRSLYILLGELNVSLKTAFDFEYWLRAFNRFPQRVGFIDEVQAYSRLHDDCITLKQRRLIALEGLSILHQYIGKAPVRWLLTYIDEFLEQADGSLNRAELVRHLSETVEMASPYLSEQSIIIANKAIAQHVCLQPSTRPD